MDKNPLQGASRKQVRRAAIQALENLERAGVSHIAKLTSVTSKTDENLAESETTDPQISQAPHAPPQPNVDSPAGRQAGQAHLFDADLAPRSARPHQDRAAALEVLQREVAACTRCKELAEARTQTVFGVGNPQARLCFLGEAPGADEDAQGEPFVGRAGQLLTRIIEACTLKREDVYILNVLKCRPPGNRNPAPEEVANCRGFLDRQLEIIRPEFICCLGAVAATTLLETSTSIGRMRGRFVNYRGIPVICTYHPAYLLRNPSAKKLVWEDMQLLMGKMGIDLPGEGS